MIFVDTNYFLRFLLKDVNQQHRQAKKLFTQAAIGKIRLFTSVIVFFEIYWVLASFYEKGKLEVVGILEDVLKMEFIDWENKEILDKAVKMFRRESLELEDVFNLVYARREKAIAVKSFDKKLEKVFKEEVAL